MTGGHKNIYSYYQVYIFAVMWSFGFKDPVTKELKLEMQIITEMLGFPQVGGLSLTWRTSWSTPWPGPGGKSELLQLLLLLLLPLLLLALT